MGNKPTKYTMSQSAGESAPSVPPASTDIVVDVCNVDEMKDSEMREVELGTVKALLVKSGERFYCVANKCSHFGAALSKGVTCNGRVRCPWHGACFSLETGDIEDFPGLDGIHTYKVEIENGKVRVRASPDDLVTHKKVKDMSSHSATDDARVFLIIGGGASAVTCAETLRQSGFKGQVIMATMEDCLPYDRTKISKNLKCTADDIALRKADFYNKYDIEVRQNKQATSIDFDKKTANFSDGSSQSYDKLVIATGCMPRVLQVPGHDLGNVFTLRSLKDANTMAEHSKGKNIVIMGSSFVGMELAMYFSDKAASVTVIVRGDAPFINNFGRKIGLALMKLHETKGVKFQLNATVKQISGDNGVVTGITLGDDTQISCDICIQAVGSEPASDFVKDSRIKLNDKGYITVDQYMKTNIDDVFACGDVVEFPLFCCDNRSVSIGHWQMALKHGQIAGYNMVDRNVPIESVPYFWTQMFGKNIRYTGYSPTFDDVIIHGELDELKFVAFYTKGDNVVAVSSLNFDPIVSQVAEMFAAHLSISKEEIRTDPHSWLSRLPPP